VAYEHERAEWRAAVQSVTAWDHELANDAYRRAIGVTGDPTDAHDDIERDEDDDE
jgi:hypothetical protein